MGTLSLEGLLRWATAGTQPEWGWPLSGIVGGVRLPGEGCFIMVTVTKKAVH